MAFVSALAVAAALGISILLADVPLPPKITLAQRIAPVADPRVALTLLCTWFYQSGHFIVYTYFTVVFDRAIGHNAVLTGALLVIWGVSGTISNLVTGRLADAIGDGKLIPALLIVLAPMATQAVVARPASCISLHWGLYSRCLRSA
jgi:predicted MFS family arabinose efflux permease